jgi:nitrate reductase alpha subunit
LPSAPQLQTNPLQLVRDAAAAGVDARDHVVKGLQSGTLKLSCTDPDHPNNWPRNLFVWRSNLLGSSGKGHEYFLKHLLGTSNGVQGKDLGQDDARPSEVVWHEHAPQGKLDLLVTLDFRLSTTCLYTRFPPRWIRRGRARATGRSTRASPGSTARSASATSASRRKSC